MPTIVATGPRIQAHTYNRVALEIFQNILQFFYIYIGKKNNTPLTGELKILYLCKCVEFQYPVPYFRAFSRPRFNNRYSWLLLSNCHVNGVKGHLVCVNQHCVEG